MDFFCFILLTGVMMIRPEELNEGLTGARLYLWTLLFTMMASAPKLLYVMSGDQLREKSISVSVVGFLVSIFISAQLRGRSAIGMEYCEEFIKVVLYYFLLIAIIDTPERLRIFMGWLVVFVCGVATVAVLHYYEIVDFTLLEKTIEERRVDPETGEVTIDRRALASGIFGDPNDLCLILVLGIGCCGYHAASTPAPSMRIFWLAPVPYLFWVLSLTGSRGGMLAMLTGFAAFCYGKVGWRVGVPFAIVGTIGLLAVAGGRGANITGGGTAHERLALWQQGLGDYFRSPFFVPFGLGPGYYVEDYGLLAHNSFINAYVEFGLIGGGLFAIAFVTAIWQVDRIGNRAPAGEWAVVMRPYMLFIIFAYAAGCFSLSRHLVLPTYLVLGIVMAYTSLATDPPPKTVVGPEWLRWAFPLAILILAALKLFTQFLGQAGV
jgi:putative inorganic carbon (hco3(-)) transporter